MKLFKKETHLSTHEWQRIGCITAIVISILGWLIIISAIKWYISQPLSSQEKVKNLAVVEESPRLEINTETVFKPQYLDIPLSHELQDYVKATVKTIKPELVFAVMEKESGFDNSKIGQAQEVGFMQIHPSNFGWLASDWGLTDLHDPYQNIKAGIILLEYLTERESDIEMGLMYYNMKPSTAEKLFSQGIFHSKYSMEVMKRVEEMEVGK